MKFVPVIVSAVGGAPATMLEGESPVIAGTGCNPKISVVAVDPLNRPARDQHGSVR